MAHGEGSLGSISIDNVAINFAENVMVREVGRPRLSEYRVIGKQHTVYGQLGAESRQFTLSFNLTRHDNIDEFLKAIRQSTFSSGSSFDQRLPTVIIAYGAAFQSIRGICKSYNIGIEEKAGYDEKGHANRYNITMQIAETQKPKL